MFSVNEPHFIKALEAIAGKDLFKDLTKNLGGRLFNIVVDNENTSKILLKKQAFSGNVIFIPNNKIVANPIPEDVILSFSVNFNILVGYRKSQANRC